MKVIFATVVFYLVTLGGMVFLGDMFNVWKKQYGLHIAADLHGYAQFLLLGVLTFIYYRVVK